MSKQILINSLAVMLVTSLLAPATMSAYEGDEEWDCQCSCQQSTSQTDEQIQSEPKEEEPEADSEDDTPQTFETGSLIINEFVSDPVSGEDEWVELYNPGNEELQLDEWKLVEGSGKASTLTDSIPSHGFVIVEPAGALNNSGDEIVLLDPTDKLIDRVSFGSWDDGNTSDNAPTAEDPNSVARNIDGLDTDIDNNDFLTTETATLGQANQITNQPQEEAINEVTTTEQTPEQQEGETLEQNQETEEIYSGPTTLLINEIFANTGGNDAEEEFIELYNFGDLVVDLAGWIVSDGSGKTWEPSDGQIDNGGYQTIYRTESSLALNNSTPETINLVDPNNILIDNTSYEKANQNQSYSRFDELWFWTTDITPDEPNRLPQNDVEENDSGSRYRDTVQEVEETEVEDQEEVENQETYVIPLVSINEVREVDLETTIQTSGVVSVEPGILGSQFFYLAGSGIQVYMHSKDFPELITGDMVSLIGTVSESRGERRIKLTSNEDIAVVGFDDPPEPHEITLGDTGENTEGWLVTVSGTIIDKEKDRFILSDGDAETTVLIKTTTGITLDKFDEGLQAQVTGIVSQWNDDYRVLPRYELDMTILEEIDETNQDEAIISLQEKAKNRDAGYAIITSFGLIGVLGGLAVRNRQKKKNLISK